MKSVKSSVAQRLRESEDSDIRPAPTGPRSKAWARELAAKRKAIKKLPPGSDAFNEMAERIVKLAGDHVLGTYHTVRREISAMFDPKLPVIAAKLEKACEIDADRWVQVYTEFGRWADGWFPEGFVSIHGGLTLLRQPTVANLREQVVAALRRESEALAAMANKLDGKK
jgi:hypothetical protein